ncbi:BlaI/MecI/CopY family transcriptional regulator [Longimicrobium sp.]|uniref:BlaI/MecI/CopY family transcriptional regulator n=1 Tax=Longimicrobium sp. TaxID=2029185 RepID=UPI002BA60093|nr:BlaI/MecI/CopY family transcriptional regulator [Longimicrobium sp.]HSU15535.1 BlaI/MecI/CopY family transcriptional regulator [Longimicrobium sp.]
MSPTGSMDLGRRERQIMDAVYRLGRATAAEVLAELPDPPSYSAVRGMLRLLEDKGYLRHEQDGPRYVYLPTTARDEARRSALAHLVRTFFNDSRENAVAALLDQPLDEGEYRRLRTLLDHAREPGDEQ